MALKDRLRRFTRSDRSSSTSSRSNSTTLTPSQTVPSTSTAPLQKSSSRLNLSKTLTSFTHKKSSSKHHNGISAEDSERKIEEWRKKDEAEWRMPSARRPGRKSQKCQDVLRAFEFGRKEGEEEGMGMGRNGSVWSGVSPGTSRVGSLSVDGGVDDGGVVGRVLSARSARGGGSVGRVVEE